MDSRFRGNDRRIEWIFILNHQHPFAETAEFPGIACGSNFVYGSVDRSGGVTLVVRRRIYAARNRINPQPPAGRTQRCCGRISWIGDAAHDGRSVAVFTNSPGFSGELVLENSGL